MSASGPTAPGPPGPPRAVPALVEEHRLTQVHTDARARSSGSRQDQDATTNDLSAAARWTAEASQARA